MTTQSKFNRLLVNLPPAPKVPNTPEGLLAAEMAAIAERVELEDSFRRIERFVVNLEKAELLADGRTSASAEALDWIETIVFGGSLEAIDFKAMYQAGKAGIVALLKWLKEQITDLFNRLYRWVMSAYARVKMLEAEIPVEIKRVNGLLNKKGSAPIDEAAYRDTLLFGWGWQDTRRVGTGNFNSTASLVDQTIESLACLEYVRDYSAVDSAIDRIRHLPFNGPGGVMYYDFYGHAVGSERENREVITFTTNIPPMETKTLVEHGYPDVGVMKTNFERMYVTDPSNHMRSDNLKVMSLRIAKIVQDQRAALERQHLGGGAVSIVEIEGLARQGLMLSEFITAASDVWRRIMVQHHTVLCAVKPIS